MLVGAGVLPVPRMNRMKEARWLAAALCLATACAWAGPSSPDELAQDFAQSIDRRLRVPQGESERYAALAENALVQTAAMPGSGQYLVVVDRNPRVQALMLFWRSADGQYDLVGAAPVSTGAPGRYDHFETPTGVFEHDPRNPDFRAEGTYNENNIRGYGARGMRVYDFGWQHVPKGWGDHAVIEMRLQMHATDPDVLEQRVGRPDSKGCVRIPATLNRFLDHYGVLDANYEPAARSGRAPRVLQADRDPVAEPGRYLVIVDSGRSARPAWAVATRPGSRAVARNTVRTAPAPVPRAEWLPAPAPRVELLPPPRDDLLPAPYYPPNS